MPTIPRTRRSSARPKPTLCTASCNNGYRVRGMCKNMTLSRSKHTENSEVRSVDYGLQCGYLGPSRYFNTSVYAAARIQLSSRSVALPTEVNNHKRTRRTSRAKAENSYQCSILLVARAHQFRRTHGISPFRSHFRVGRHLDCYPAPAGACRQSTAAENIRKLG